MKLLILFSVVVALALARPGDDLHYDTKYDNFNMDELVANKRLLKSYAHCFIGDGKCTPEGNDVKKWIPEGTKTGCKKCTEKQKVIVAKFVKGIQEQCPEEWETLNKQMDPEGVHKEDVQKFIDEYAK